LIVRKAAVSPRILPQGDGARTRRFQGDGLEGSGFFLAALRRRRLARKASANRASLSDGGPAAGEDLSDFELMPVQMRRPANEVKPGLGARAMMR